MSKSLVISTFKLRSKTTIGNVKAKNTWLTWCRWIFFTLVLPSSSSQIESGLILLGCPTRKRLQLTSTGRLCILRGKCCHYMHSWRGRSKWGSYFGPKADASEVPGSQEVNIHLSVSVATIPEQELHKTSRSTYIPFSRPFPQGPGA